MKAINTANREKVAKLLASVNNDMPHSSTCGNFEDLAKLMDDEFDGKCLLEFSVDS